MLIEEVQSECTFLLIAVAFTSVFECFLVLKIGSSTNLQYRTERIKIPLTPRYPRSMMGSDRGELFHK